MNSAGSLWDPFGEKTDPAVSRSRRRSQVQHTKVTKRHAAQNELLEVRRGAVDENLIGAFGEEGRSEHPIDVD